LLKRTLAVAFKLTLPVLAGYLVLGVGFGVLLRRAGYGAGWAAFMSAGIYAGAMQYVAVDLLVTGAGVLEAAMITLTVNARHLFYGLTMAQKYRDTGKARPYLAFSLTDETFALLSMNPVPADISPAAFYVCVSLLNHLYWVLGSALGSLLGMLPFDFSGIGFSMTALFAAMLTEQWRNRATRGSAATGLAASLLCLLLLGPARFTVPAILVTAAALLFLTRKEAA
jgi:4-azaleucine resistance transporter AzlC